MDLLPAPFHFAATFLVTVAAFGGTWVTIYRPRYVPEGSARRFLFGFGWLLLALGELLHGSLIAASEQNLAALGFRMSAYVMLVAGLRPLALGKTRPADPVEDKPTPGLPGAGDTVLTARPPVVPAVRRLILALGLFASSEVFFALVDSLSTARPGGLWFLVHGLRLAGGLAVLAWLGQVVRTSIQARVVAVFIGLMLVVVVAISGSMTQVFTNNFTRELLNRAQREGEVQQRILEGVMEESMSQAQQVARSESVRQVFATRPAALRQVLERLQGPGQAFDEADFMAALDPQGALLAVSAAGPGGRDTLAVADALNLVGTQIVQAALSQGEAGQSVDTLGPGKIAAIGVAPVFNPENSERIGVLVTGRLIDLEYLEEQRSEGEVFLITRNQVLASTTRTTNGIIPTDRGNVETLFENGRRVSILSRVGDDERFNSYVPLVRGNEVIGAMVFSTPSGVIGLEQQNLAAPLFFIALWATAMGVGLSLLFGTRITQPIRDLTEAADRVREGDLTARVSPKTYDEVGVLGETFDQMTVSLAKLTRDLRDTAEEQVQLRRRLETILQSMTDGVVAVNNHGVIVAFNREAERILEVSQSQVLGRNVKKVLQLRDSAGKPVSPAIYDLQTGSVSGTVANLTSNVSRPVVVTSAPIADEAGEVLGAVAVLRDLTREVEIEKMKTEFLANISHELRTPITPIKGYSDLLRRREVPREQQVTFLEGILASAERLERIVEMLVDFSAMEAGRLEPNKVAVDFDQVTADLVEKWAQNAPNHKFERTGFSTIPSVEVDRRLVPLAISELVDNAVKFSPNGGKVLLSAEHSKNGKGNGYVRISVKDEGIGIDREQLSKIGQNFVQADGSETRAYGGLGLGLAYVRRIAEGHGGKLEVESEPEKGSCFTLVFPAGETPQGTVREVFARK
ncbi:MAG TPA: ATP-binding protein [Actinomycetota bacterium]|nr:ATP-binding protein [Actinomycetota bacterium]